MVGPGARLAEGTAESSVRALRDVSLELSPLPSLVSDSFAITAHGKNSLEHFDVATLHKSSMEQRSRSNQNGDVNAGDDPFEEP